MIGPWSRWTTCDRVRRPGPEQLATYPVIAVSPLSGGASAIGTNETVTLPFLGAGTAMTLPGATVGGDVTSSVAVACRGPGSPLTVTVCGPGGVEPPLGTVSVVEPGSDSGPAVAPGDVVSGIDAGTPLAVDPGVRLAVSPNEAVAPRWIVWDPG